jgi:hypothetical protein
MLCNHTLKNVKCGLVTSFTLTLPLYAADNTINSMPAKAQSPAKSQTSSTITSNASELNKTGIKWAPLETAATELPNQPTNFQPDEMTLQRKRELLTARISELNSRYQQLRQDAQADGIDLADTPPWTNANFSTNLERMQAIINAMTPEERDVCTTVHRLSMGLMQSSAPPLAPPPPYGYASYPPGYGRAPTGYSNYGYVPEPNYYGYPNYSYGNYNRGGYRVPESWQGIGWQ